MDLVIRGGTVLPMDGSRSARRADVRIAGDRIAAIGEVGPEPARVLDARGAAVLPGLVQCHVHLCQALFRGMADDLPLLSWLRERIWPLEAAHDARSLRASARLGLAEMLLAGTTTILDMGTVQHQEAVFEAMAASGVRGRSGKSMIDRGRGLPRGMKESTAESLASSEALCRAWHGAAGGRIGYAFAPRFVLSCSPKLLEGAAGLAERYDTLVHTHAAEHRDERAEVRRALGVDDVAHLAAHGVAGPRAVLAHGVQLGRREMRAMGRRGTRVVHCPSANLKLASGVADLVAMREAGIEVGLGADGAPCNNRMDPWTELRSAALLAKAKRGDAAALSPLEALERATLGGARVLGLDHLVGSLEVGKKADVVVVGLDGPHQVPGGDVASRLVYATTAADVRHVVVDGQVVVRDGELRTLDRDEVVRVAREEAARVVKRAGLR